MDSYSEGYKTGHEVGFQAGLISQSQDLTIPEWIKLKYPFMVDTQEFKSGYAKGYNFGYEFGESSKVGIK